MAIRIAAQRAYGFAVGGTTVTRGIRAATRIIGIALRQPIKPRVRCDARGVLTVLRTGAFEKNFRRHSIHAPDLGRTRRVANGATAGRALKQFFGGNGERFHSLRKIRAVHPPNVTPRLRKQNKILIHAVLWLGRSE